LAAYAVLQNSKLTIIPLALQSFGYAYGSLLGVFLVGMLTKRRGRDGTNVLAMIAGIVAVLVLCKVRLPAFDLVVLVSHGRLEPADWTFSAWLPPWWPEIAWSWWVFVGCSVCFIVSWSVPTPEDQVKLLEKHLSRLDGEPMASRQG
jgi:solute:Na+ symporter, SSS family